MSKEDINEGKSKKPIAVVIVLLAILLVGFWLIFGRNRIHTVTFDSNGGTAVEEQEVRRGEQAEEPTDPTREGFEFVSWYLGEEVFNFESEITEDITLVASWVRNAVESEEEEEEDVAVGGGWMVMPVVARPSIPVVVAPVAPNLNLGMGGDFGLSWQVAPGMESCVTVTLENTVVSEVCGNITTLALSDVILAGGAGTYHVEVIARNEAGTVVLVESKQFTIASFNFTLASAMGVGGVIPAADRVLVRDGAGAMGVEILYQTGVVVEFNDMSRLGVTYRYTAPGFEALVGGAMEFAAAVGDDDNNPVVRLVNNMSDGTAAVDVGRDVIVEGGEFSIDFGLMIAGAFDVALNNINIVVNDPTTGLVADGGAGSVVYVSSGANVAMSGVNVESDVVGAVGVNVESDAEVVMDEDTTVVMDNGTALEVDGDDVLAGGDVVTGTQYVVVTVALDAINALDDVVTPTDILAALRLMLTNVSDEGSYVVVVTLNDAVIRITMTDDVVTSVSLI